MQLQQRINAFVQLGTHLQTVASSSEQAHLDLFQLAKAGNRWFTEENIKFALTNWSASLTLENLQLWVEGYQISEKIKPKTVGIVMAGNIPLVGFHDFLSTLICGHKILAKLSSNDKVLMPYIANYLASIDIQFNDYIAFTEGSLEDFDAVIATGSNNTARYFDFYFSKYPNIIRKNRNSVAVITGHENKAEMEALAGDIFQYFGLGCRNVSKIYLPKGYHMDHFFNAMYSWKNLINNDKYINNYDYNKAVYLMSNVDLLDNEFMLLKEDNGFSSPISVVFYQYYNSLEQLALHLSKNVEHIQCIVTQAPIEDAVSFGNTQTPNLWDYADNVDTIKFLLEL